MTAYTRQAKTLVKKDSGWKLKADDSDCWALKIIVSRQQRTTAAMWLQTSLFTLKTLFPQKTNKKNLTTESFTKPTSIKELQLLKF